MAEVKVSQLRIAPKSEQPRGGYLHPKHLLAYGPVHRAWSAMRGEYETDKYCVAPSCSIYDKKYLRD